MMPIGVALLEFNPQFNLSEKKKLRDGLSVVVQIRNTLWVTNDETASLERLTYQSKTDDGDHGYSDHTQFLLHEFLRLPVPPSVGSKDRKNSKDSAEVDVEGLDYGDHYLWLVGSHSLTRKQPEAGKSTQENFLNLQKVGRAGNRFLLARIPLVEQNGTYTLQKNAKQHGKKLVAAQLRGDDKGNDLIEAIKQDKHLKDFLPLPGKDNGFDIEGLAVVGKRLLIGLRGPVLRGWAIILEVEPEADHKDASTLRLNEIGPGHRPYRKHFLQLGGLGIRDLCVQGADLLILAGPTMDLDGPVTVFRWQGGAEPEAEGLVKHLTPVLEVPYGQGKNQGKDHAEGMTLFTPDGSNDRAVLIVYDSAAPDRQPGNDTMHADIFTLSG